MACLKQWEPVEQAKWDPLPSLGIEWMAKWWADDRGYQVMMTDGCGLWGECRGAKYIVHKAEEWAPCIEAGIREISSLVLSEVTKMNMKVAWSGEKQSVNLQVASKLNSLSYRWEFELNRLSNDLFRHHWVTPLFIQLHHLGLKVKQLTSEVEQKQRQLEELLPDNKPIKNSKTTKTKHSLVECVEAVCVQGPWAALQDHLTLYPDVMQQLSAYQSLGLEEAATKPKPGKTTAAPIIVDVETEEEIERREAEEERKRRAEIQKLTQDPVGPPTPSKKKKKLKI